MEKENPKTNHLHRTRTTNHFKKRKSVIRNGQYPHRVEKWEKYRTDKVKFYYIRNERYLQKFYDQIYIKYPN